METSALTFGQPAVLHWLWLLPLFAGLFWWAERRRRALVGRLVAPKLRALLAGNTSPARRVFRGGCVLGALALLVVALAGPRLGYDTIETPHRGRDVVIAMDVSRSMLAPDVAPTRLQRAKLLVEDLVSELGGDRIGLVAFAGSAFLQAPLTLDHGAVLVALDELDTDLIPKGGTNIAAAIRASEEAFTKAEGFSRAILIISDGEELDADGVAAARAAAEDGIRIFTVGVGSPEGSEIPLPGGDFVRDPAGKVVTTKLDESRLREIAGVAGGFYTPLDGNAAQLLATEGIGRMEAVETDVGSSRRPVERYQWPLGAAIALLVLQALVGERRRTPAAAAAAVAMWFIPAVPAFAGLSSYEEGNYEEARRAFEARLGLEPDAPNLLLNAGTATYRLKDYGKAAEYFSKAMLAGDPALRSAAEFNLGNTLFRQGEGQQDKTKKISDWKDAIAQYEAALKTRPDYTEARENKERVEQLLEQLESEQEQPQEDQKQQDQQKQDQQDQQEQQQGGQQDQQDQQKGDQDQPQQGGGQDEQEQDQQGGQDQPEPSGEGGQDQREQQGQSKDEQKQDGQGGEQDRPQQGGGQPDQKPQDGQQGDQDQQQQGGGRDEQKQDGQDQRQPGDGGAADRQEQDGRDGEKEQPPRGEGGEQEQQPDRGEGGDQRDQDRSSPADERRPAGQPGASGDRPAPVPTPAGEKKEGELRASDEGRGEPQDAAVAGEAGEERPGQMSESQARALLRSLQGEEERVDLLERRAFQDVSRDW
jgi:Ca-activated chloride channel family protein